MQSLPGDIYNYMRPHRICICKAVSEDMIRAEIRAGARDFKTVQKKTRCSTGCGTCEGRVRRFIDKCIRELAGGEAQQNLQVDSASGHG
ncbi:MAG: (2Fe-2S)-binding protein [Leptospiraceae bacterium]|nr:(2Fe-2S)-binding protein [Leptospiraceae bacterium]MCB1317173.1 (2Fe-2S)-binding protein [Leptospiraceae bacterium]